MMSGNELCLRIGGVTDLSTVDWYGYLSMVIFWAGCNFRCPYCQNSSLIPLDSGELIDLVFLRERIEKSLKPIGLIDAVVFTGGEPLLQPEGVMEAARLIKEYGLKLMLDTNGSVFTPFREIIESGLVDRVALDVKAPLNVEEYSRISGLDRGVEGIVGAIKSALKLCKKKGVPVEVRTTVAPKISDNPRFIKSIAENIKGYSSVYYLQQFDNQGDILDKNLKEMKPPTREKMIELAETALQTGLKNVYIKTRVHGLEKIG
jgi:pyruvate formate lyase activating enzyme